MGERVLEPAAGGITVHRGRHFWRPLWPYGFAAPAIAAIGFAFVYPLVQVIRYSFYTGSANSMIYVGTANYSFVFQDPVFRTSLFNNLKLLATVPVMTALALLIALLLNDRIRGWRQYRAVVFLPYILPATAIGITFSFLLERNGGLNTLLSDLGLGFLMQDWLGSTHLAIPSIGGVIIWQQLGFGVVVFSAALLALPAETVEAAQIDGGKWWTIQRRIVIPQIRGIIEFFVTLEAITVLSQVFAYVYVLTAGGPANASSVLEYYIWVNGFSQGSTGIASAVAVIMLGLASILIVIYMRLHSRNVEASGRAPVAPREALLVSAQPPCQPGVPVAATWPPQAGGVSRARVSDLGVPRRSPRAFPAARRSRLRRLRLAIGSILRQGLMLLICVVSLYPVWFVIQTALKTNRDYTLNPTGLPTHPTLKNITNVLFHLPVPHWALNSALVTLGSVAIATVFALLAGYAIVFGSVPGREFLLRVNIGLMVVPPVALLVPMFVLMVNIGLINTLPSVIIFYSGLLVPFSVFFFVNFFRQVPGELIEAATVDGASQFTILRRVVLPISGAAVFTLVIVNSIWAWTELLIALVFLQNEGRRTLMAGLTQFQGRFTVNEPLVLAATLMAIVPVVLIYLGGQRFFIRGLTAGIGK